jgi:hypothetical protein
MGKSKDYFPVNENNVPSNQQVKKLFPGQWK